MQRSKPDRAPDVDAQTTLEDVFASRNFGKQLPDPLGLLPAVAMADAVGPRAAGIVRNRFVATLSVAAAVLSLAVVGVSTGTVKAPTLSAQHAGAPGPLNPNFSDPAVSGSGTATGNGGGSAGTPAPTPTSPTPGDVLLSTTQGGANATVPNFAPSGTKSSTAAAPAAPAAKAPATVTTAPPPAPPITTTTTPPPATTTTTTTPPQGGGGSEGDSHRPQWPPWGNNGPATTCDSASNGHVVATCP